MTLSLKITFFSVLIIIGILVFKLYETFNLMIFEKKYWLMLNILTSPLLFLFMLFPIQFLLSNLVLPFLNIDYLLTNSKYYSCKHPLVLKGKLPSVTIQIPVYDEDFIKVLRPMLRNCVDIRDEYIESGGRCNIIVNDDGIFKFLNDDIKRLNSCLDVRERVSYYKKYKIAFTARGYKNRKGKFKKASNMNFCFNLALRKDMNERKKTKSLDLSIDMDKSIIENMISFDRCYDGVYINKHMRYGDINFGKYILLIDSDSIIPNNFLRYVVNEFENDKKLAYTQHYTIPLSSSYQNYFSRYISHFTINLYEIIFRVATRNGDISPLIGHNLMIRKEAMDIISRKKYWSEDRVSEDFDLCIRFHNTGYYGKYIAYKNKIFQEGVSLSYKDEMNKYSKFAYGASEIIFNPVQDWCKKGILTRSFYRFLRHGKVPCTSKLGVLGYLMTYFSIASSIIISPGIIILSCYEEEWQLFFFDVVYAFMFLTILFSIVSPISAYIIKKKLEYKTVCIENPNQQIPKVLLSNEFKASIFFCLFYSSISFPIFLGVISHLLDLNISWGSTVKHLDKQKRCKVLFNIIYEEKIQFFISLFYIFLIVFSVFYLECSSIYPMYPLMTISVGHLTAPFILNPSLFKKSDYDYDITNTPPIEGKMRDVTFWMPENIV